jgi:hypothetical protein
MRRKTNMEITSIVKITEGSYSATSLPCPKCGDILHLDITGQQLFAYNQGSTADKVFPEGNEDLWERFISGYCNTCWDELFGDEEDE